MTPSSWRTSLVAQALDERTRSAIPVVVGLVDTVSGGVQVALRVGDHEPVILQLQDASQLALNLHATTAERLKVTAERLSDGDP